MAVTLTGKEQDLKSLATLGHKVDLPAVVTLVVEIALASSGAHTIAANVAIAHTELHIWHH